MAIEIATKQDLEQFKTELLRELHEMLRKQNGGMKPLLTTAEVRKLLGGMSIGTLQTLRTNGVIPFYKIGGKIFYHMEDIMKVVNEHKMEFKPSRFADK